jgi:hypothetical protein
MDGEATEMSEPGGQTVSMIDNDEVAVIRFPLRNLYDARRRRFDRASDRPHDIEPHMNFVAAIKWIEPGSERASNGTAERPYIGRYGIHYQTFVYDLIQQSVLIFQALCMIPKQAEVGTQITATQKL